jgi:hypothetical protein
MNSKNKIKYLSLVPAYFVALFDCIITITHQSKSYWNGDLKAFNEANPIGAFFMSHHVSGIFIVCLSWLIIIFIISHFLKGHIRDMYLLFVLIAHSVGASSWLSSLYGFWSWIVFVGFNSILYVLVNKKVQKLVN